MKSWPSGFPLPLESLVVDSSAIVARSTFSNGPVNQRRRFVGQIHFLDVSWELTDEQLGQFLIFHRQEINLGCDWFLAPIPLDGTEDQILTIRLVDGKFKQSYVPVGYWNLSARVELKERPTKDEDWLTDRIGHYFFTDDGELIVTDEEEPIFLVV